MTTNLNFSQELVTPERASDWLERNTHNRAVSRMRVSLYASDMANGLWRQTAEPIMIAPDGTVVNGQHRLLAVVQSGASVVFTVAWNVPNSSFEVIDQGLNRGLGQIFTMQGIPYGNVVAAAGRMVLRYRRAPHLVWTNTATPITPSEVELLVKEEGISAGDDRAIIIRSRIVTASSWAAATHIIRGQAPSSERWEDFREGVIYGTNLDFGDPRLALRNYHGERWGAGQSELMAVLVAWNHYVNQRNVNFIRAARGSLPMPTPQ